MPYESKWEKNGFYSRFWGLIPESEVNEMNHEFSNDERCDKARYQIFDGTDIEAFTLNEQEITTIASNDIGLSTYIKNIAVALVGSKPEIKEAYQQYIDTCQPYNITWKFRIFDTLDEARSWLNELEA